MTTIELHDQHIKDAQKHEELLNHLWSIVKEEVLERIREEVRKEVEEEVGGKNEYS